MGLRAVSTGNMRIASVMVPITTTGASGGSAKAVPASGKEITMKCRFLREDDDNVCAAGSSPYAPSIFEAEEYCFTDQHLTCSSYCVALAGALIDPRGQEPQSHADAQ